MTTVPPSRARPARDVRPVLAVSPVGARRRPSGEPPPLPRHFDASTPWLAGLVGATVGLWVLMSFSPGIVAVTRADQAALRVVVALRWAPLTEAMRRIGWLGSPWVVRVLVWSTIVLLLVFRRFQHLAVYLALLLTVAFVDAAVGLRLGRMRPAGVEILAHWSGYSHPSAPVAALALVLAGALYTLVPPGVWRTRAKFAFAAVILLLAAARVYLAVDHPSDVAAALAVGWALPVVMFRLLTPDDVVPVVYRRGRAAHLDVGGRRGEAITQALTHQLGLDVSSITPFGLGGSAGSTPLKLTVRPEAPVTGAADGDGRGRETVVFGKLYALTHLRSDRWYKLMRTILYGRLEDEKPFSTVRRLVEYEDHLLRLLRDAGLPTPRPYGFAEITPEREYVVVMEFFEGASEMAGIEITDATIDEALAIVRRLWDAGVAHRDIKPSNVLVRDGHVFLIDVAFAAVRPTPWRQAVDLANMMLTLALCSSPDRVYARALQLFAPEDLAEAFAASRSVTIPTQLRSRMRADGRDLIGDFRRLAPPRRPVSIQLWSVRRVGLTLGLVASVLLSVAVLTAYLNLAGFL